MKAVKVHLSSAQQDDLETAPGETLNEKARWVLTNYWPAVLEQHRARRAAEMAAVARPAQLQLVAREMNHAEDARVGGTEVATANALISASEEARAFEDGRMGFGHERLEATRGPAEVNHAVRPVTVDMGGGE